MTLVYSEFNKRVQCIQYTESLLTKSFKITKQFLNPQTFIDIPRPQHCTYICMQKYIV